MKATPWSCGATTVAASGPFPASTSRPAAGLTTRVKTSTAAPCAARRVDRSPATERRREPVERRVPPQLGVPEALGIEAVDQFHPGAAAEVMELDARDHRLGHAELGHRVRAQHEQRRRFELEDLVAG